VQFDYVLFGPLGLFTLLFFPLLRVLAARTGARVVVTMHETLNPTLVRGPVRWLKARYVLALNRTVATTADQLVFLSPQARARFTHTVAATEIPHGVDLDAKQDLTPAEAKAMFGYRPDTTLVVEPGYVSPRKGSDVFRTVAERCPEYEFLLAGGPPRQRHSDFFDSIREEAPANLTVTGRLPEDRFHAAFAASDLAVLPYNETEQTGVVNAVNQSGVFNWCGAYGVPVVATDCARFRALKTDYGAVELFEVDRIDDIVATVRGVLEEPERRDTLSTAITAYATANSLSAAAADHIDLYRSLT
jgi:glycosyltransferase involved in cell wall biosynthesis